MGRVERSKRGMAVSEREEGRKDERKYERVGKGRKEGCMKMRKRGERERGRM